VTSARIGDLARPKQWRALSKSQMVEKGYPVYGANGVIGHSTEFTHAEPTLLIGCRGTIGAIHITAPQSFVTGNAMALDSLDATSVDINYLARFLAWRGLSDVTSGTSQPQLTRQNLVSVEVPLPGLAEQRRIAAVLDHADALRAKRRLALDHLDSLASAVFYEMFGDPLTNSRGLPRSTIGEVAPVVTGNSPSRAEATNFGGEIEWIKSDNLGGAIATRSEEWLSRRGRAKARIAPQGSILVTCIAGSPTSIGKASSVDRDVAFNQQINAILPSSDVDSTFLLGQLKVAPELVRAKSTGGMKGLVNKSAFQSIEILTPSLTIQRDFAGRIDAITLHSTKVRRSLATTDELFFSLQSRAFRGGL
jgi:type I restriction enzyme, S subunit